MVDLRAARIKPSSTPAEPPVQTGSRPATAAPSTPPSNTHLVNAFDYVGHVGEITGYYFTTPSGRWRCAIWPRTKAGCQASGSWKSGLGITVNPSPCPTPLGRKRHRTRSSSTARVTRSSSLSTSPEFWLNPGPANVLQFNRILAAAGFRCNVQEKSGVSCLSEASGKGFTFSAEGYTPQYTDVPADAP